MLSLALLLSSVPALADEPEPASAVKPRELKVEKGVFPRKEGGAFEPTKITSKAELAKAIPDEATAAAIAKQVDFKQEFVLLFVWSGSGGDRLTMTPGKEVVFTMTRGRTRDLRRYAKLFALPRGTKYRVGK